MEVVFSVPRLHKESALSWPVQFSSAQELTAEGSTSCSQQSQNEVGVRWSPACQEVSPEAEERPLLEAVTKQCDWENPVINPKPVYCHSITWQYCRLKWLRVKMDSRKIGWECAELYSCGTGQGLVVGSCEHEVVRLLNEPTLHVSIHPCRTAVSLLNEPMIQPINCLSVHPCLKFQAKLVNNEF
jgi:hypothetical protein